MRMDNTEQPAAGTPESAHRTAHGAGSRHGPVGAAMQAGMPGRDAELEALRESERILRSFFDSTGVMRGIVEVVSDNDIRHLADNAVTAKFLGTTPEAMKNRLASELGEPPEIMQLWITHYTEAGKKKEPVMFEFFDGRGENGVWLLATVTYLETTLEGFPRFAYVAFDITERKMTEEAVKRARDELEIHVHRRTEELHRAIEAITAERLQLYAVLETLPAYVCLLDEDYRMPFANKTFREMFREPAGRRCYDFLFDRDTPCENCETYKVMKTRSHHHWYWTGPNGRDYDIYDFPFTDTNGEFMILEMGIDITDMKKAEAAIAKANAYNRSLIEASLDPLVTISPDGKISDVNEAATQVTGFSREELVGTDFSSYFTNPEKAKAGYEQVFRKGQVTDYALEIRRRDGHITPVLYNASVYRDASGIVAGVFAMARDVTKLKKAEAAIKMAYESLEGRVRERTAELAEANIQLKAEVAQRKQAESRVKTTLSELHAAIESTADGIYAVDRAGKVIQYNQNFASIWKIPEDILRSRDDQKVTAYLKTMVKNPGLFEGYDTENCRGRNRETYDMLELVDGRVFERYSKPQKMGSSIIGRVSSYRDVTDRKHAEEKLLQSLQEKETLIREIHHRVKNNLQIISGLLDMTRMRMQDSTAHGVLTDMMMKIKTMAQIHTRLYESKQFDRINMGNQIRDQVADLSSIYGSKGAEIEIAIETEDLYLPVDQAIPCALVVNEVLSNAFKHAYRGRLQGTLHVSAGQDKGRVRIIVEDDGGGLPGGIDVYQTPSLGLKLIRSLALQLGGSVEIASNKGTKVTFEFPLTEGGR